MSLVKPHESTMIQPVKKHITHPIKSRCAHVNHLIKQKLVLFTTLLYTRTYINRHQRSYLNVSTYPYLYTRTEQYQSSDSYIHQARLSRLVCGLATGTRGFQGMVAGCVLDLGWCDGSGGLWEIMVCERSDRWPYAEQTITQKVCGNTFLLKPGSRIRPRWYIHPPRIQWMYWLIR